MFDGGMTKEEIADAYRTTPRYVTQRMRLAAVSPALLEVYARNGMPLAMLEAFTVNPDHARQEQVWEAVQRSYNVQPWQVRQLLTETTVPTDDKRVRFVGVEAYEQAGGSMLRDLFSEDDGGWLEDVALLDRLVAEKLKAIADDVAAEGWKWIEVDTSQPYGHDNGLREITGRFADLTDQERAAREALRNEYDDLESEYSEHDELPEEIDRRLGEIEAALEGFEKRPIVYDPAEIACAGVFISIDRDGEPVIDRGYVRPEDEPVAEVEGDEGETIAAVAGNDADVQRAVITVGGQPIEAEEEEDTIKPLPERLVAELTAHRTVALSDALGGNPHIAMTALLHRLVRDRFKQSTSGSAVRVSVQEVYFREQGIDLKDSPYAKSVAQRHAGWKADLPSDADTLWDWLDALDDASRMALLAHCVSFGINALYERPNPHSATGISEHGLRTRMAEADRLARVTGLDMAEAGFQPTVANYLGRVTKPRILEAVHEALGEDKARLIDHLKKDDMAREAERLLADTGWLPEPLRLLEVEPAHPADTDADTGDEALPAFLTDEDEASADADEIGEPVHMIAAE